jgi:hypothetical protein
MSRLLTEPLVAAIVKRFNAYPGLVAERDRLAERVNFFKGNVRNLKQLLSNSITERESAEAERDRLAERVSDLEQQRNAYRERVNRLESDLETQLAQAREQPTPEPAAVPETCEMCEHRQVDECAHPDMISEYKVPQRLHVPLLDGWCPLTTHPQPTAEDEGVSKRDPCKLCGSTTWTVRGGTSPTCNECPDALERPKSVTPTPAVVAARGSDVGVLRALQDNYRDRDHNVLRRSTILDRGEVVELLLAVDSVLCRADTERLYAAFVPLRHLVEGEDPDAGAETEGGGDGNE